EQTEPSTPTSSAGMPRAPTVTRSKSPAPVTRSTDPGQRMLRLGSKKLEPTLDRGTPNFKYQVASSSRKVITPVAPEVIRLGIVRISPGKSPCTAWFLLGRQHSPESQKT